MSGPDAGFLLSCFIHFLLVCVLYVTVKVCNGWTYKGICLQNATAQNSADVVPLGCDPYQPNVRWSYSDFYAICRHFSKNPSGCTNYDRDNDGGRCSNYLAIAAFEDNSGPDVWVSYDVFYWNPTSSSNPNCKLLADPPGTVIYACNLSPKV